MICVPVIRSVKEQNIPRSINLSFNTFWDVTAFRIKETINNAYLEIWLIITPKPVSTVQSICKGHQRQFTLKTYQTLDCLNIVQQQDKSR